MYLTSCRAVSVAVARAGGRIYAFDDTCTHEEYSLCEGELWEMSVECPRHGSRFDVRTGKVTGLPAVIPTKTYPVTIQNGDVYVEVGE